MLSVDVRFLKGYGMIRSYIGSTQDRGVVLKIDGFSHLICQSFGLDSPIELEALSLTSSFFPYMGEMMKNKTLEHLR